MVIVLRKQPPVVETAVDDVGVPLLPSGTSCLSKCQEQANWLIVNDNQYGHITLMDIYFTHLNI